MAGQKKKNILNISADIVDRLIVCCEEYSYFKFELLVSS